MAVFARDSRDVAGIRAPERICHILSMNRGAASSFWSPFTKTAVRPLLSSLAPTPVHIPLNFTHNEASNLCVASFRLTLMSVRDADCSPFAN